MSYYGDYYGGYGDEQKPEGKPPGGEGMDGKPPMHEMDGDKKGGRPEKEMSPVMMAFMLVPLGDLFTYYKINDFNTASTSEWTTAGNVALAGGALKLVGIVASKVMKMKASVMMLPAISVVQEIASLYFINSANGVLTSSDVNMYYGITGFNLVVSAANAMMMKSAKKGKKEGKPEMDGQWDDQQKEGGDRPPKDGDKPPKPDGGYDGYYGYY